MIPGIAYFAAFLAALACIVTGLSDMPLPSFSYCIAAILCIVIGTVTLEE